MSNTLVDRQHSASRSIQKITFFTNIVRYSIGGTKLVGIVGYGLIFESTRNQIDEGGHQVPTLAFKTKGITVYGVLLREGHIAVLIHDGHVRLHHPNSSESIG